MRLRTGYKILQVSCLSVFEVKSEVGPMTSLKVYNEPLYKVCITYVIHFVDQLNEIFIIDLISV
ncbi:conserved hypothetical protein [Vibrio crassostreae]|nr:conserved hypothetical protein [Vibrio crassostreae]CAK2666191.1 conserved hypothetical protein [Vibrio crassostreae]CAK2667981.1 conserved hypothetical protein [Vibrio crassostreae]CAK2677960.1 conserved hypothetical protein [Vibrio crassostreae]CAK3094463.1 conserved hypothetical protein [Vibrio crassostreae]